MTSMTHSGKWSSPRYGKKASWVFQVQALCVAQMSEQGAQQPTFSQEGLTRRTVPLGEDALLTRQEDYLTCSKDPLPEQEDPSSAGGDPMRQEESLVPRVGGPPHPHQEEPSRGQQKLLPHRTGRPSLSQRGQQDLTGLLGAGAGAGAAAFLQTSPYKVWSFLWAWKDPQECPSLRGSEATPFSDPGANPQMMH